MLTPRQHQALIFIDSFIKEKGWAPSYDEIGKALGLDSKSGIHRLVVGLVERGRLRRLPNRARAIEVVRDPILPASSGCPLFRVAA